MTNESDDHGSSLLGHGHIRITEELLDRLHRLQNGESLPRIVVLEGASGTGKSRVVREVYQRLRLNQPGGLGGYWPALPDSPDVPAAIFGESMPVRHVIGASALGFVRPPGTLPSFFWWPIVCTQMNHGSMVDVVQLLLPEIRAHLPYLAQAWRNEASAYDQFRSWVTRTVPGELTEVSQEAGLEVLGAILDNFSIVVPGVGYAANKTIAAATKLRDRRRLRRDIAMGGALAVLDPAASVIFEQMSRVILPTLPIIIAVEDLHLMGDGFADLLDLIAAAPPQHPFLVIGTAWPEARGSRPVYDAWLDAATGSGDGRSSTVEVWPMPALDRTGLTELARRYVPETDPAVLDKVVERWANPYALQLLLTDERVQEDHIHQGALRLSDRDLERLPRSIEGLYQRRWEELPRQVRQALMVAAGCLPDDTDDPKLWTFLTTIIVAAATQAGVVDDSAALTRALARAADPHQWLTPDPSTPQLGRFADWVQARIAAGACQDRYGNRDFDAITRDLLGDWVMQISGRLTGDDPVTPTDAAAARWLLALQSHQPPTHAAAVATVIVARAAAEAHHYVEAITAVQNPDVLDALSSDDPFTLTTRALLADWTDAVGQTRQALTMLEGLVPDQTRVLSSTHRSTLATGLDIALYYDDLGYSHHATELLETLLPTVTESCGERDPLTLRARNALALSTMGSGRYDRAIPMYEALLADYLTTASTTDPDVMVVRNNLAHALGEQGAHDDSVEQFTRLVADRTDVLGPDHLLTLATRANLALAKSQAGRPEDAIEDFQALLPDETRVVGDDYPSVLTTRNNLAWAKLEAGLVDEALTDLRQLVEDRIRINGLRHPETYITRSNLALALGRSGHLDQAITQFQALVDDETADLDATHPSTLISRNNLAAFLAESGQADESAAQYRVLLQDMVDTYGLGHPYTVSVTDTVARLPPEPGDFE